MSYLFRCIMRHVVLPTPHNPCWRSNSPFSSQLSSSTPFGCQIRPSLASGNPPPLLAVHFTTPPLWSSSTSSGSPFHPSPPSGHPPTLLVATSPLPTRRSSYTPPAGGQLHPSPWLLVFQGERGNQHKGLLRANQHRWLLSANQHKGLLRANQHRWLLSAN